MFLANINVAKLDAAFDIDPLFYKMSKTFDEGGAKGLLLANLGVSESGANIVFDSTLEEEESNLSPEEEDDALTMSMASTAPIDVSNLTAKLNALLLNAGNGDESTTVNSLPLVPQLAQLREEYFSLDQDGFVDSAAFGSVSKKIELLQHIFTDSLTCFHLSPLYLSLTAMHLSRRRNWKLINRSIKKRLNGVERVVTYPDFPCQTALTMEEATVLTTLEAGEMITTMTMMSELALTFMTEITVSALAAFKRRLAVVTMMLACLVLRRKTVLPSPLTLLPRNLRHKLPCFSMPLRLVKCLLLP